MQWCRLRRGQQTCTHHDHPPCPPPPGRTGSIALNLQHLDPTGLNAMELLAKPAAGSNQSSGALLLCASPSKRYFRGTQTHVENAIRGVTQVPAGIGSVGGRRVQHC